MVAVSKVRVRFAPSPTGFFHIGSARTALFNWLYARRHGGKFILRIEDTDRQRNTEEALRVLLDGLRWLGLDWDEGPEVGGEYGPYFQSERMPVYEEFLERLRKSGRAYEKEGAVFFRLEGDRYTAYDDFLKKEVEKVRSEPVVFEDGVRGRIERAEERDFPILRSSGEPTFHFTNVVDDITMGITHVIRGEDHLTNTSKHIELFRAFGVEPPRYAHLPLILKDPSMGKGKMSKRDRGSLIEEYQRRQFIPAAVRNYLCLLGWSPKDDREKMPIGEIIQKFDFEGIQRGAARFDEKKLHHLNALYLHEMPVESLAWVVRPIITRSGLFPEDGDESYLHSVLALAQEKIRGLDALEPLLGFFFSRDFTRDPKALERIRKKGDPNELLREIIPVLKGVEPWTAEKIGEAIGDQAARKGEKPFLYFPALRYQVTGQGGGPDLLRTLEVLGKEETLARIEGGLEA